MSVRHLSVEQVCVAACCSVVLQCGVALCCSVFVAVCRGVLQTAQIVSVQRLSIELVC